MQNRKPLSRSDAESYIKIIKDSLLALSDGGWNTSIMALYKFDDKREPVRKDLTIQKNIAKDELVIEAEFKDKITK